MLLGCSGRGTEAPSGGQASVGQIDRYLERGVALSSQGVVLMPSQAMERETDRTRMTEIARALQLPLSLCFLRRTIEAAEIGEVEGQRALVRVPQGQLRVRARLNGAGEVQQVELMEGTFEDSPMVRCIEDAVQEQAFPAVRSNTLRWIDVVHWVSLGYDQGREQPDLVRARRLQVARLSRSSLRCLEGRLRPGTYRAEGVNLVDRTGSTLVNRIEPGALPGPVARCVAQVFKALTTNAEPESYVRAILPVVEYQVDGAGVATFADAEWLRLLDLEAAAQRAGAASAPPASGEGGGPANARSPAIQGVMTAPMPDKGLDPAVEGPRLQGDASKAPEAERDPGTDTETEDMDAPALSPADPSEAGLRLRLGGRGPREEASR